jgi:hypothetical protein
VPRQNAKGHGIRGNGQQEGAGAGSNQEGPEDRPDHLAGPRPERDPVDRQREQFREPRRQVRGDRSAEHGCGGRRRGGVPGNHDPREVRAQPDEHRNAAQAEDPRQAETQQNLETKKWREAEEDAEREPGSRPLRRAFLRQPPEETPEPG